MLKQNAQAEWSSRMFKRFIKFNIILTHETRTTVKHESAMKSYITMPIIKISIFVVYSIYSSVLV